MGYESADQYLDEMKALLDDNWAEYQETPKPQFIVINDPESPEVRVNYNDGDAIIISTDSSEQIRYRGNIQYYDRIVPVSLDIRTKENRQRLHDMWKMVRIILFSKKHDFPSYQLIKMIGYQEMVNEELNIWRGVARVQLDNHCISVDALT